MFEVQKYLRDGNTLEDLTNDLGIKVAKHETKPLIILNYDQIDSPKTHPIVRECRGLILEDSSWDIVARSFERFFNWGEVADEMPLFNFDKFHAEHKEDGSLSMVYNYKGEWMVSTRGSFAELPMQFQEFTWREAMCNALGLNDLSELDKKLDPKISHVCEFTSLYNKVVRTYNKPQMFLLSAFDGHSELSVDACDELANEVDFVRPKRENFDDIDHLIDHLNTYSEEDPTFEGYIIRDDENRRWKVKSATYLSLHKMRGEGDNLFNPKNHIPYILGGNGDKLIEYFPEVEETFITHKNLVEAEYHLLSKLLGEVKDIENQKEFAMAVVGKTPFTGFLFQLKKENELTQEGLEKKWRNGGDSIHKVLFKK